MESIKISKEDKPELIGQLIDIFEDFLEEKGIEIENPQKTEDNEESAAILYGDDYAALEKEIEKTLVNWKLLER